MADDTAKRHGAFLEEYRLDRGLRWSEVARDMQRLHGVSVTADYLGKIKRGTAPLARMSVDAREALRAVLGISAEAWRQGIGLYVPDAATSADDTPSSAPAPSNRKNIDTLERQYGVVMKNVYDLAQASRPVEEMEPDPEVSPVPVLKDDLYPGTVLFRVRGDSMSIPGGAGIEEGDIIYCDTRDLRAREGEVFVLHIPGEGVTVKRVRGLGGQLWLFSDNPDQIAFPPFTPDGATIVGRVHFAFRPLPQFKRRTH